MARFLFFSFTYVLMLNLLFAALVITGFGAAHLGGFLGQPALLLAYPLMRAAPLALTRRNPGRARETAYYLICLFFDLLLAAAGGAALIQGNVSAAYGGGLLGGFGILVIAAAAVFNLLTFVTIRLASYVRWYKS